MAAVGRTEHSSVICEQPDTPENRSFTALRKPLTKLRPTNFLYSGSILLQYCSYGAA